MVESLEKLDLLLARWATRGSKASRKRRLGEARRLLQYLQARGVRHPSQIGRRAVYDWIDETNHYQRYYVAALIWRLLGRGTLPKPRCLQEASQRPSQASRSFP